MENLLFPTDILHTGITYMEENCWFTNGLNNSFNIIQHNTDMQEDFLKLVTPDDVPPHISVNEPGINLTFSNNLIEPVSYSKVVTVIKKKKKKDTSPGPDKITYTILNYLPHHFLKGLPICYTIILHTGIIPLTWQQFFVIPIQKPNMTDADSTHYRPIMLSNTIRKVMENILNTRISHYTERTGNWPQTQFGFQKGHTTLHTILTIFTEIYAARIRKQQLHLIAIDISKAYDNVNLKFLSTTLQHFNIPQQLNLISNRQISFPPHYQNTSNRISNLGIPQGSALSPILFTIYTHFKLNLQTARIIMFADDIFIMAWIPNTSSLIIRRHNRYLQFSTNHWAPN